MVEFFIMPNSLVDVINFDNGIIEIPSIKTVNGNLHQRINQRHNIKRMEEFLTKDPMNKDNCA